MGPWTQRGPRFLPTWAWGPPPGSRGPDPSRPVAQSPPVGTQGPGQDLGAPALPALYGGFFGRDPCQGSVSSGVGSRTRPGEYCPGLGEYASFCLFSVDICWSRVSNILAQPGLNPTLLWSQFGENFVLPLVAEDYNLHLYGLNVFARCINASVLFYCEWDLSYAMFGFWEQLGCYQTN